MQPKYDYVIIDPASPEFNRGSFCYLAYILFSALKATHQNVLLVEDFTCSQLDNLPDAENYLVALWSYPQIDAALVIDRFLKKKPRFFGYYPIIDKLGLKKYRIHDGMIELGIQWYVQFFSSFKHILLSDCDMHLSKYEGQVYPLFTSYGCSNRCGFCPVGINCERKRVVLPLQSVYTNLDYCDESGYKNIHFTDEDFFYNSDRAYLILKHTMGRGFNYIALGSVHTVSHFIEKYGVEFLEKAGMRLIEVGLESADPDLNKAMGKPGFERYEKLAEQTKGKVDIFWLTMTFFPGETIKSLRATGLFLEKYGFALDQLYGRVQTNSTKGGLGQFYQFYEGTMTFVDLLNQGEVLNYRPIRLLPSFVPNSFLNSEISNFRVPTGDDVKWYKLYRLEDALIHYPLHIEFSLSKPLTVEDAFSSLSKKFPENDVVTYLAISARLGVIA